MNPAPEKIDTLLGAPGLRFVQIDYALDSLMPTHSHDSEVTFNYCLAGSLLERRNQQEFHQQAASLSLLPAGTPHSNRFPAGARVFLVVMESEWLPKIQAVASTLESASLCSRGGAPSWIAARLHREFLRRDSLTPLALEGMVFELVAELSREYAKENAPYWIRDVTDLLHAHFTENLSANAIASTVSVHPSHLMRAFRQRHGCTIGEYIRALRVEHASHLLETSEVPLAQVAHEVGFCDQGHLGRAFKERIGVTPGQFRRTHGRTHPIQKMQS